MITFSAREVRTFAPVGGDAVGHSQLSITHGLLAVV
jgi:hypothetical protein